MNYNDIIGTKIGKWTVESLAYKTSKSTFMKCICDCGTVSEINYYKLINRKTKSCGCSRSVDATGMKIGRLLFIEKIGQSKEGLNIWKCQCDCGNVIEVEYSQVSSQGKASCGCLLSESARKSMAENTKKLHRVDGTCIESMQQQISKNNTSGVKGVTWCKSRRKWVAQIMFKRKHYHLGRFDNIEDAIKARKKAEVEIFGKFIEEYNKQQEND